MNTITAHVATLALSANFRATLRYSEDDEGKRIDAFDPRFVYLTHDANGQVTEATEQAFKKCQASLKTEAEVIKRAPVQVSFSVPTLAHFGIDAPHKVTESSIIYEDKALQPLQDAIISTVYNEVRAIVEAGDDLAKIAELSYFDIVKIEASRRRSAKVAAVKISRAENNAAVAAFAAYLEHLGKPKAGIDMQVSLLKGRCKGALSIKPTTLERILANIVEWVEAINAAENEELAAQVAPVVAMWMANIEEALGTDTDALV